MSAIYVVPVFGGPARKLVDDAYGFAVSPDDKRIAVVRSSGTESFLMIADSTGNELRTLASRATPDAFDYVAWSPDEEHIACLAFSHENGTRSVVLVQVNVSDGVETPITSARWEQPYAVEWIAGGRGLIVCALLSSQERGSLWFVSYPGGEVRKITTDASHYNDFTLTADSETSVCAQSESHTDLWLVPVENPDQAKQITTGAASYDSPSLTADDKVVCESKSTGRPEIWVMDSDGSNQRQLTNSDVDGTDPAVSSDGRLIAFSSGGRIWRMAPDGSESRQLTGGSRDTCPQISPDGSCIVYVAAGDPVPTVRQVPLEGGVAKQMTSSPSWHPVFSPDGKYIACFQRTKHDDPFTLQVQLVGAEKPTKSFSLPKTATISAARWLPDATGVAYCDITGGVCNIWVQPIDGSARRQLTTFKSDPVNTFDFSRDGKHIICSRVLSLHRLVLMKNEN